jgi:hypothetical protein
MTAAGVLVTDPGMDAIVQGQKPVAGIQVTAGTKVDLSIGGRAP